MFKDEEISKRHRYWGWNVPVVDIDFLSIKNNIIIEFKEYRGIRRIENYLKDNKGAGTNYTATQEFADSSSMEYYIASYNNSYVTLYPANKKAKNKYEKNFKIPKSELEKWIEGQFVPKIFSLELDMMYAIEKTNKPTYTSNKFNYKVAPERTSWRDKNLDNLRTNDVKSFLGLEYDKGKPVILVEYIDVSKKTKNMKERNINIDNIELPLIFFYYDSNELLSNNRMYITLEGANKSSFNLLNNYNDNNWNINKDNKIETIESNWIKFLYYSRGYKIESSFLDKIKMEIDKSYKQLNNNQHLYFS